jgi:tRNA 2-thiouridine synthesizing protein A
MPDLTIIEFDLEVDASGLNCPLPLLRLKKALMEVQSGDVIKIIATDPAAHLDIGVYVDQTGHQLLEFKRIENRQIFFIRKNSQV